MRGTAGDHAYSGYGAQGDDGTVAQARAQVGLVPGPGGSCSRADAWGRLSGVGGEGWASDFSEANTKMTRGPNRVDGQDDERRVVQGAGTVLMAAGCPAAPVRRDGHTFPPPLAQAEEDGYHADADESESQAPSPMRSRPA